MRRVALAAGLLAAQARAQGVIAGTVVAADGRLLESATVRAARTDRGVTRDAVTDSVGAFRIATVAAGTYTVTVHRIGYRSAELPNVRVSDGQTRVLNVTLTQAPTQLSTIEVVTSPTAVDASTPELTMRLDRTFTELLPSARDASSLIALVPGSRKNQLWGGAPGVSNDYRLDGVSMNHPGLGGDFLAMSVDWIESLEIKGLGAGAEFGNFQGGIINAVTRSGGNDFRYALRTTYESPKLTGTNLNANEVGSEQAGRRELSGEVRGPVLRDRLLYFAGAQYVSRDVRSPDLTTPAAHDFQPTQEEHRDVRGMAKVTWLPASGQRVEALGGFAVFATEHAGINGVDDPSATQRVRQPAAYWALTWNSASHPRSVIDVRIAGFRSRETREGYDGAAPGVQVLQLGRMPAYQNSAFTERLEPGSVSGSAQWTILRRLLGVDHQLVVGADASRGTWRDSRTRNGGLTWRPYTFGVSSFDAADAGTWGTVGSDWGGDMHVDSRVSSQSYFVQEYASIGSRLTITPGLRAGRWSGDLNPTCQGCPLFRAVTATALDPRVGASWDVTGHNTMALKAHWGRYHQGMFALFFDRAAGGDVYRNSRFYYSAPALTDSRQTFTTYERDTPGSGFSTYFDETIMNETGRVENYRQPYVDQLVLGAEKSIGARWKVEVLYTTRANKDIVGLVDRNRATNYSPIYSTFVDNRFASGRVVDANGAPLALPVVWVSNKDLKASLNSCGDSGTSPCTTPQAGYTATQVASFTWNPDLVLTTVPEARRDYRQFTFTIRTSQNWWRADGSLSLASLKGNVAGVTGYGTTGTQFSAGPFVHPNEAINFDGTLPDAQEIDARVWATAVLPWSLRAGALWTHTYGETFAATFAFNGRYVYSDSAGNTLPSRLFQQIVGQNVFVEPRGMRHYPSRDVVDLHVEWRSKGRVAVTLDLFNATGDKSITLINTNLGDRTASDPTSYFAATRLRTSPRTLRAGLRID